MENIQVKEFPCEETQKLVHVFEEYELSLHFHMYYQSNFQEQNAESFNFNLALHFKDQFQELSNISRDELFIGVVPTRQGVLTVEEYLLNFIRNKNARFYKWLNYENIFRDKILPDFASQNSKLILTLPRYPNYSTNPDDVKRHLIRALNGEDNLKQTILYISLAEIFCNHFMLMPNREVRPSYKQISDSKKLAKKLISLMNEVPYFIESHKTLFDALNSFIQFRAPNDSSLFTKITKHAARNQLIKDINRILSQRFLFTSLKKYQVPIPLIKSILKRVGYQIDTRELYSQLKRVNME